jgi:hypothetical protein
VREEAFRVAADQDWCDDGLNKTLAKLGLPLKVEYTTWVEIPTVRRVRIDNKSAQSQAEADAAALSADVVTAHVPTGQTLSGEAKLWQKEPGTLWEVGEPDPSNHNDYRNHCKRAGGGYECTLHRETVINAALGDVVHHVIIDGAIQHVCGNGTNVFRAWTEKLSEVSMRGLERHGMMDTEAREAEQQRRDAEAAKMTETIIAS